MWKPRKMLLKVPLVSALFGIIIISLVSKVNSSPVRAIPIPGNVRNATANISDTSITEPTIALDEDNTTLNSISLNSAKESEIRTESQKPDLPKETRENVLDKLIAEAVSSFSSNNTIADVDAETSDTKRDGRATQEASPEAAALASAVGAPPSPVASPDHDAPIKRSSLRSIDPFTASVDNLFATLRNSLQNLLVTGQLGLLRAIGTVDQTVATKQDAIQNTSFSVVLEGQKTAAKLYDLAPPVVNRWIQRVGTTRDLRLFQQVNDVLNQYRDNSKNWYQAWYDHEHDWHNHWQNVWSTINGHLRVPELPRMQFGWY